MAMLPTPPVVSRCHRRRASCTAIFNDLQRRGVLSLYGRRMYETMRYWGTDDPNRSPIEQEFAKLWQQTPKLVVSTTLREVEGNARLISGDVENELRRWETEGEIEVGGPTLAAALSRLTASELSSALSSIGRSWLSSHESLSVRASGPSPFPAPDSLLAPPGCKGIFSVPAIPPIPEWRLTAYSLLDVAEACIGSAPLHAPHGWGSCGRGDPPQQARPRAGRHLGRHPRHGPDRRR